MPVIWIKPRGEALLVTKGSQLTEEARTNDITSNRGFNLDDLSRVVCALVAPPNRDPSTSERNTPDARQRLERFLDEPDRDGSWWSTYTLMRYVLIGRPFRPRVDYAVDQATKNAWSRFNICAKDIGGGEFASRLHNSLEARWRRADNVALHYSHVYRSAYILNYVLASIAVIAGLLSVFWWNAPDAVFIKASCALVEVLLIGCIMRLTSKGNHRNGSWHTRWLEARSAAELLRSARLLALVARTATPRIDPHLRDDAWVEWYVRSTLREIGIPSGILNSLALETAITSAIDNEINDQITYNTKAKAAYHDIDHKLHAWGNKLFKSTLIIGVSYLLLAVAYAINHRFEIIQVSPQLKDFIKASVTFLGAGMPALGAALFGIQATGDFKVSSEQTARTSRELADLKVQLENEKQDPKPARTSQLLLALTQTLTSDLRDWAKIYRMRELTLPG